ncbi:MAG: hypothetical protein WAZ12_05335 [Candidatus Absconditicoccaceae bacterium]
MSNNIDKFTDTLFLEASIYPTSTAEKIKKYPGELLEAVKNADTRLISPQLDRLGNSNKDFGNVIKDLVIDSQRGNRDFNDRMYQFSDGIKDMGDDIQYGLDRVNDGLDIVSKSIESAYGSKLPKGLSMAEIGKLLSFNGKRSVIALAVHGGIEESDIRKMFSNNFVDYLKNGVSLSQAKEIQSKILKQIYYLQNINSRLREELQIVSTQETHNYTRQGEIKVEINKNIDEITKLRKTLISEDEKKLLELGLFCRKIPIEDLIHEGIIEKNSLQGLVNNHKITGNLSSQLSKIFVRNLDGFIEPLVSFDGDIGRRQAQMLTGYKVEAGFEETNQNLSDINETNKIGFIKTDKNLRRIDDTLQDGFIQTSEDLEIINNTLQEGIERTSENLEIINETNKDGFIQTNKKLKRIDNTLQVGFEETVGGLIIINKTNKIGFIKTDQNLRRIDDTLQAGFDETNQNLVDINETNKIGFIQTNHSLRKIDGTLQVGFIKTVEGLKDIDNSVTFGFEETNRNLENISTYTAQMNTKLGIGNQQLGNINLQLSTTNGYLYDILATNLEENGLLQQSNFLSEESNNLIRISNQVLANISREVVTTKEQLIYALDIIGNTIVLGFNRTLEELKNIQIIGIQNIQVNQEILEELKKQSAELEKINEKLLTPLEIKSNEHFKNGLSRVEIGNRKRALESFEKGIDNKNNHLFNLYGAGLASSSLGKSKESKVYFIDAYTVAIKAGSYKFASEIAFDISKLYIKNLKLSEGKKWLNETIGNNIDFIEAYFLKARICKLLAQESEFELLINIIFNKIIEDGGNFNLKENYQDILEYIYQPTSDIIDQEIQNGLKQKLFKLLPRLEAIGHQDAIKNIVSHMLFIDPIGLNDAGINIKNVLQNNKEFFQEEYKEFSQKIFHGGQSIKFFMITCLGHKIIDQTIINKIIKVGLSFDLDYIDFKHTKVVDEKRSQKQNLINKIYSLDKSAKYMLRDYLKDNANSPLN